MLVFVCTMYWRCVLLPNRASTIESERAAQQKEKESERADSRPNSLCHRSHRTHSFNNIIFQIAYLVCATIGAAIAVDVALIALVHSSRSRLPPIFRFSFVFFSLISLSFSFLLLHFHGRLLGASQSV